jgi:hypothetical protein
MFIVFLGHFNFGKRALINPVLLAMGKLTFEIALIYPIVIAFMYGTSESGIYLSLILIVGYAGSNIIFALIFGFVLYIIFEYPTMIMVRMKIMKKLSQDDVVENYFKI